MLYTVKNLKLRNNPSSLHALPLPPKKEQERKLHGFPTVSHFGTIVRKYGQVELSEKLVPALLTSKRGAVP